MRKQTVQNNNKRNEPSYRNFSKYFTKWGNINMEEMKRYFNCLLVIVTGQCKHVETNVKYMKWFIIKNLLSFESEI